MDEMLKKIPERQVYLVCVAIIVMTLLASYLYLFKNQVKGYSDLKHDRLFLQSKVVSRGNLAEEINKLKDQVEVLSTRLHGRSSNIPTNKLIAHNINQLDKLSNRHAVQLESVKPGISKRVEMFDEIPLSIRVTGSYFNLYKWLHDVEIELGPMVVKQFDMTPYRDPKKQIMNLKMVSYVPVEI